MECACHTLMIMPHTDDHQAWLFLSSYFSVMTDTSSTNNSRSLRSSSSGGTLTRTGQPSSRLIYHKVCLTGIAGVGKTSLFLRIKTGEFPDLSCATTGIDTFNTAINLDGEFVGVRLISNIYIYTDVISILFYLLDKF